VVLLSPLQCASYPSHCFPPGGGVPTPCVGPSPTNKEVPTLDIKLSGASTYPEWILPLQGYLDLLDITGTEYQVWDVVEGTYEKPASTANRTK